MALQLGFMKGNEWKPLERLFGAERQVFHLTTPRRGVSEVATQYSWTARHAWLFEKARAAAQDLELDFFCSDGNVRHDSVFRIVDAAGDSTDYDLALLRRTFIEQLNETAFAVKSDDGIIYRTRIVDWNTVNVSGFSGNHALLEKPDNTQVKFCFDRDLFAFAADARRDAGLGAISARILQESESESQIVTLHAQPSGGGGGAMRSDKVDEVCYRWCGNKALGLSLGLDMDNYSEYATSLSGLKTFSSFAVNVPASHSLNSQRNPAPVGSGSEIFYTKRFLPDKTRKNSPRRIAFSGAGSAPPDVKEADSWPIIPEKNIRPLIPFFSALPVDQRDNEDLIPRKKRKGVGAPPPGVGLVNAAGLRASALSVMGVSATDYAVSALGLSDRSQSVTRAADASAPTSALRAAWLEREAGPSCYDQEWCHLQGHGDGGDEVETNFVSGSKHCNTEQLAIESGHRKGGIDKLKAKITAYLFDSSAPHLAQLIRYKIYAPVRDADGDIVRYKKIFDHLFDAQSKSFNYHEFKILKATVERVVAAAEPYGAANDYYTLAAYADRVNATLVEQKHDADIKYAFDGDAVSVVSDALRRSARKFIKTKARAPAAASSAPASAPAASGSASGASGASASAPAASSGDVPMSGADSS